jgi:hypothetical protein
MDRTFLGASRWLDDINLPKLGHRLGAGEDEHHSGVFHPGNPIARACGIPRSARPQKNRSEISAGMRCIFL